MGIGLDPGVASRTVEQILTQPLYDTVVIPTTAVTTLPLFALGIGSGASAFGGAGPKTEVDTNLPPNGQLPIGWLHKAKGLSLVVWSTAITQGQDSQIALAGSLFRYALSTTVWFTIPAKRLTGGCGIVASGTYAAGTTISHNGDAQAAAIYPLEIPIETVGGQAITASLNWPGVGGLAAGALTAAVPATLLLEGNFYRRV